MRQGRSHLIIAIPPLILLAGLGRACDGSIHPPEVEETLRQAGPNRGELEEAIRHFQGQDDPLKLDACLFLLQNMRFHYFERISLFNERGQEVRIDFSKYPDLASLRSALAEFERNEGPAHWGLGERAGDARTISARQLIENVELAFQAWRDRPWAKALSWEVFRDVVLPYRVGNERLESWRETFMNHYRSLPQLIPDGQDWVVAADQVNRDLGTWFGFDERLYYQRTDMTPSEMRRNGRGRCEDLANLAALAMRAIALPVSVDYTPFWPHAHGNHFWNVLHTPQGEVPFMGCEMGPGGYDTRRLGFRFAKVYRKTFAERAEALPFQVQGQGLVTLPSWLASRHLQDVTARYASVSDLDVSLTVPPGENRIAYLAVFNSGSWNPIDWAVVADDRARFREMGVGIAYLPCYFEKGQVLPAAPPLILEDGGHVKILDGRKEESQEVALSWVKPHIIHGDGLVQLPGEIERGKTYHLFRWEGGWRKEATAVAMGAYLQFQLREGALYWLIREGSQGDEERIFTIEQRRPRYW